MVELQTLAVDLNNCQGKVAPEVSRMPVHFVTETCSEWVCMSCYSTTVLDICSLQHCVTKPADPERGKDHWTMLKSSR